MWPTKWMAIALTAVVLIAGSAWFAHSSGKRSGMSEIQSRWDAEVAAMALAQAAELERAMAKTAELQAQMDQIRRSHRNEVNRIRREHAALVDSLRDRPEARADPGSVSTYTDPGTGLVAGCTGAQLSGPDARFLAGEVAVARELQSGLLACLADRAEIERQLNGR